MSALTENYVTSDSFHIFTLNDWGYVIFLHVEHFLNIAVIMNDSKYFNSAFQ